MRMVRSSCVTIHGDLEWHWMPWSFMRSGCHLFSTLILADLCSASFPPAREFDPHNPGPEAITFYTNLYTSFCLQTSLPKSFLSPREGLCKLQERLAEFTKLGLLSAQIPQTVNSLMWIRRGSDWPKRECQKCAAQFFWRRMDRIGLVWSRWYSSAGCREQLHPEWKPAVWTVSHC